jgi:hypothetical protein
MKKSERQTYFLAIVSLQLSGNAEGRISPGEVCTFRFLFAYVSIALRAAVVKAVRLESSVRIMSQDCNLKIHNALWRNFRERNRLRPLPGLENRETWGTRFGKNELLL